MVINLKQTGLTKDLRLLLLELLAFVDLLLSKRSCPNPAKRSLKLQTVKANFLSIKLKILTNSPYLKK
jgi:hypothetical protein